MTSKKVAITEIAKITDGSMPYVLESASFRMNVHQYQKDAQREIDALDGEINRLQVEIEARHARRQDLSNIVILADMVLSQKLVGTT